MTRAFARSRYSGLYLPSRDPGVGPTFVSVGPTFGTDAGGTAVTISGSGFSLGITSITFDGAAATSVVAVTDTTATCATPSGTAGAVDVVVTVGSRVLTLASGFTYTSGGGVPSDAEFFSDWLTATGESSAAILDTDKSVPWVQFSADNSNIQVVSASGLDFPTTNVLRTDAIWRPSTPGGSSGGPELETVIAIPAIGESLHYRVYLQVATPDAYTVDPRTHPCQDGPGGGSNTNWQLEINTNTDGTFDLTLNWKGEPWPKNRHRRELNKNQTYRIEHQVSRIDATTCNLHVRVYDSSDVLLFTDIDFVDSSGSGTLADNPVFTFTDVDFLAGYRVGANGWSGGVEEDYGFIAYYWGGCAIRTEDWCGPYAEGF